MECDRQRASADILARRVDKGSYGRHNELLRFTARCARMAELADAPGSGPGSRKGVEVRVLFRAPRHKNKHLKRISFLPSPKKLPRHPCALAPRHATGTSCARAGFPAVSCRGRAAETASGIRLATVPSADRSAPTHAIPAFEEERGVTAPGRIPCGTTMRECPFHGGIRRTRSSSRRSTAP